MKFARCCASSNCSNYLYNASSARNDDAELVVYGKENDMKSSPAVDKVAALVIARITSGAFRSGEPLPNREVLARLAGVSPRTVSSAIARLKAEGVLEGVSRQRVRVPITAGTQDTPDTLVRRGYPGAVDRIRDDIVKGHFATGIMLPEIKELQRRYGVSYRTVAKALAATLREGLIEARGRGYAVPSPVSTSRSSVRILFLFWNNQPLLPSRESDRALMRALEQECLRNGVHFDCAAIGASPQGVVMRSHEDVRPPSSRAPDDCAGVIYLVSSSQSIDNRIFSWLAHSGRPLSIVDWHGGWEAPGYLKEGKQVQWIRSRTNRDAGLQVGRYLLGLGHKRIAFFSPYTAPLAKDLAAGLIQAAAMTGQPDAIADFAQKQLSSSEELGRTVMTRYNKFVHIGPGLPPDYSEVHRRLARSSWDVFEDATLYEMLEPSFDQALADTNITAWVGSDDTVALMAWSYLRSRKRSVPGDISLVGFDNTFEALQFDITSYDFSVSATASAALHFLLRPSWAARIRGLSRPRIDGTVIQRGSTARV
jgi:DNA-binding LacI/PurR family transcriptional regulator